MQERKNITPLSTWRGDDGQKKGDTFSFTTPNGKMNYKIVGIK